MEEFSNSVNNFLTFRKYKILPVKGKISNKQAKEKAESEYDIFNKSQQINSDFDKETKKLLENKYSNISNEKAQDMRLTKQNSRILENLRNKNVAN